MPTESPQQSPPSQSQASLLFSSSHELSPFHCGDPQPLLVGDVGDEELPHEPFGERRLLLFLDTWVYLLTLQLLQ